MTGQKYYGHPSHRPDDPICANCGYKLYQHTAALKYCPLGKTVFREDAESGATKSATTPEVQSDAT